MQDSAGLAAFVAVADALHLGRAAAALELPRTTVAGRLRRLEDRLGMVLVDRSHRCRIALTQDGAALLPAARGALEAARAFVAESEAVRRGRRGVVRVALTVPPDDRVERLIRTLRSVDDRWRVEVTETDQDAAARSLAIGGVECVIGDRPVLCTARSGLTDRRPNRHEARVGVRMEGRRPTGLRATWRRRWADACGVELPVRPPRTGAPGELASEVASDPHATPGTGPGARASRTVPRHAAALEAAALELGHAWLDARRPDRVRIRWTGVSRQAAHHREVALRRREGRRLGAEVAAARARARDRRRWLLRLWKGYARGDPDVRALVDGTRANGIDIGLGMGDVPPRPGVSSGSTAARRGR